MLGTTSLKKWSNALCGNTYDRCSRR